MPDIVQHCFGKNGAGGPATALTRLLAREDFDYPVVWQTRPAGGLSLSILREFIREFRRLRPKLVHIRGLGNEGFHAALAARLAGVPRILVTIHGTQRDLPNPPSRWRRWIVANLLEPATLMIADRIATVCYSASRAGYLRRHATKLMSPIPNGVPLPDLGPFDRVAAREQIGLPPELPCIVTVSRLTHEKGLGDLLAAAAVLAGQGVGFSLLIVGSGDAEADLRARAAAIEGVRIVFTGTSHDVPSHLRVADIFAFATWHENLSNAMLEAMAHGLPVVATAVGGNVELLAHGGGEMVAARDPAALAAALAVYIASADKRAKDGAASRRTVEAHYSLDSMVTVLKTRYAEILAGVP